jgi:hypothetical protein
MRDFVLGLVRVLAVALFAFIAFIIWAVVADEMGSDVQVVELGWQFVFRMVGGVVAVVALVEMIVEGLRRGLSRHLVPWTMVLLGGVLLIGFHWGTSLSLGAVAVAVVVKEAFGGPGESPVSSDES